MTKACYRSLKKLKYQLMDKYTIQTDLERIRGIRRALNKYLSLAQDGVLSIGKYYAWDGPSGPARDTRNFMRGSLVHDALYQLMREGVLDYKVHRKRADEILREICLEDGMCHFRAGYVYWIVHLCARKSARPKKEPEPEIIYVP